MQNPSFHVSVLWINGNKKIEILNILEDLSNVLNEFGHFIKSIGIDKVHCKSGNKHFQYFLK